LSEHTDVKVSTVGRHAELIGAAALVIENIGKPILSKKEDLKQELI